MLRNLDVNDKTSVGATYLLSVARIKGGMGGALQMQCRLASNQDIKTSGTPLTTFRKAAACRYHVRPTR